MSRFLFVVPPLVGHINPTLAVAAELTKAGHEVAWAGLPRLVHSLGGEQLKVYPCDSIELSERGDLTGPAALHYLWQHFFVPLARLMEHGVSRAIADFAPDLVVADQQAFAGALVAERAGCKWVTSASTFTELIDTLEGMPKVKEWVEELLRQLKAEFGVSSSGSDPRFSPFGILAFTTVELAGERALEHQPVWLVGPAMPPEASSLDFPWELLDAEVPTVLVTMGTLNGDTGAGFLRSVADAVGQRVGHLRAVLVDSGGCVPDPPPNVLVRPFVPQRELLASVDAVVCHAGHNTVCEALWNGVPLVTAPVRDDQPAVAERVVSAGAGVRLRFRRSSPAQILAAIDAVLDPAAGYQAAAVNVGKAFRSAGGAVAAAAYLAEAAR